MIYRTYNARAYVYGYDGRNVGYEIQVLCVPSHDKHLALFNVEGFDIIPSLTVVEDGHSRHVLTTTVPISEHHKCHGAVAMAIVVAISKSLQADVKTGTIPTQRPRSPLGALTGLWTLTMSSQS